jgi:hypothetical protein
MEMQVEQTDNGGSVIWTIIKIIFALGIIYFGIMYFANKKDTGEKGFVEQKPNKPKTKRKNKKV